MRTVDYTTRFLRDYKREKTGQHGKQVDQLLEDTVFLLAQDVVLPASYKDHKLVANWINHRDCHLKPDLILIYRKPDDDTLELVRMGSHSELNL